MTDSALWRAEASPRQFVAGLYHSPGGLDFLARMAASAGRGNISGWNTAAAAAASPMGTRSAAAVGTPPHRAAAAGVTAAPPMAAATPVRPPLGFTPQRAAHYSPPRASSSPPTSTDEKPPWSLDDFELGPKLGEGRFGKIYLAREKSSHVAVVLKCISRDAILRMGLVEQLQREITLQHRASQGTRRITRLFAYFWDATTIFLVLEYAEGGDLRAALAAAGGCFSPSDAATCVADVAEALAHLHRFGITHRDLKPENVLLRHGRCKLADFSWVAECTPSDRRLTFCGTIDYVPPEMIRNEAHGVAVDLWALGALMYELLAGHPPFEHPQPSATCQDILFAGVTFPPEFPAQAQSLCAALLSKNPAERLSADQVLRHPWIVAHGVGSARRSRASASPFLSSMHVRVAPRTQASPARSRAPPGTDDGRPSNGRGYDGARSSSGRGDPSSLREDGRSHAATTVSSQRGGGDDIFNGVSATTADGAGLGTVDVSRALDMSAGVGVQRPSGSTTRTSVVPAEMTETYVGSSNSGAAPLNDASNGNESSRARAAPEQQGEVSSRFHRMQPDTETTVSGSASTVASGTATPIGGISPVRAETTPGAARNGGRSADEAGAGEAGADAVTPYQQRRSDDAGAGRSEPPSAQRSERNLSDLGLSAISGGHESGWM